jgi:hypothetical protein
VEEMEGVKRGKRARKNCLKIRKVEEGSYGTILRWR